MFEGGLNFGVLSTATAWGLEVVRMTGWVGNGLGAGVARRTEAGFFASALGAITGKLTSLGGGV